MRHEIYIKTFVICNLYINKYTIKDMYLIIHVSLNKNKIKTSSSKLNQIILSTIKMH